MTEALFRVDASTDIGSGHVMRCLALADALQSVGARPHFVCCDLPGNLAERIRSRGFDVTLMSLDQPYQFPDIFDDYSGWLQGGQSQDANDFLACVPENCDLVIVDHYALDEEWERRVGEHCKKLIVIDDLCRTHCAHCVIDQTFGRLASAYAQSTIDFALTGGDYALLQPAYHQLREQLDRSVLPEKHRLLVSMGGFDPFNVTGEVVETLADDSFGWIERIDVVLSAAAPHYASLKKRVGELGEQFVLHDYLENFATLMGQSTLAVGAAGSTTWERAVLGLPAVLVPLAENQFDIAASMELANASIVVERSALGTELPLALENLREHWHDYVLSNQKVSDGLGCRRVLQLIQPAHS